MTTAQLESKLTELRALPRETEWVEFKRNEANPEDVGAYVSALANSAALHGRPAGYLVWGVEDGTHKLLGTTFRFHGRKAKGNEDFEPWLARLLSPDVDFRAHEFTSAGKWVVLIEVPPARAVPVAFLGSRYIRVGSHCKALNKYRDKERALEDALRKTDFETGLAKTDVGGGGISRSARCRELLPSGGPAPPGHSGQDPGPARRGGTDRT